MNIGKQIEILAQKGVFIDYSHEHYQNGTNTLFSIEFVVDAKVIYRTGSYGDNHDYGNTLDVIKASILMAKWFLMDNNLSDTIKYSNPKSSEEYIKASNLREQKHIYLYENHKSYRKYYDNFVKFMNDTDE